MALWLRDRTGTRPGTGELIHHSDAGSQYTSFALAEHLSRDGIAPSIGSVGGVLDNALMESTIGLYKQCRGVRARRALTRSLDLCWEGDSCPARVGVEVVQGGQALFGGPDGVVRPFQQTPDIATPLTRSTSRVRTSHGYAIRP